METSYLNILTARVLQIAGIVEISDAGCYTLADQIAQQTGRRISPVILKRLYGFIASSFEPSLFTLNSLSIFCGYSTWAAFCQLRHSVIDNSLVLAALDVNCPIVIVAANAPDFTILEYNKAFQSAAYIQNKSVRGLSWWQAFPTDNAGGYGPTLLLEAFHNTIYNQQPSKLEAVRYDVPSLAPHIIEQSWWNMRIIPVKDAGAVNYLLLHVHNITHKILHQDAIEEAILKELTEAEDLAVANVKLNQVIARLEESHKELFQTKKQLEKWVFERTKNLFESEDRQRKVIDQAPVAFAVLKGADHRVETANQKVIAYWGKGPDVVGKPLSEVLPEIVEQGFIEILDNVRHTGIAFSNAELPVIMRINGKVERRYFDMIYQPIQHEPGVTDRIFIVAFDITEQVTARQKLETSESLLRLSVTAARIGIWSVNLKSKELIYNDMFAQITGWKKDRLMTYEEGLSCIDSNIKTQFEAAVANNSLATKLEVIYQHSCFDSHRVIWLKAIGNLIINNAGEQVLSGIVKEVPEPLQ